MGQISKNHKPRRDLVVQAAAGCMNLYSAKAANALAVVAELFYYGKLNHSFRLALTHGTALFVV
jgi:hypothetical protein